MSKEMLQKVITSSQIGAADDGFLKKEQADKFIDYAWDATVLMKTAQKRKLNAPEAEWDAVNIGARIVRKATEAVDTGENAGANFTKVSLRTTKLRLDWELSTESLEDNQEGESLDDHLARMFATQFGTDLEDLAINGDTTSSDPLLKSYDGWHKQALLGGHVRPAATGTGNAQLSRAHFNQALRAMPRKFLARKGDLKFYVSPALMNDYLLSQSEMGIVPNEIVQGLLRQSPVVSGAAGYSTTMPFGVETIEVPLFDTGFNEVNASTGTGTGDTTSYLELTSPQNRIVGVQREIRLYREFANKKDTIEYTMYYRAGIAWQNLDAVVTVNNIPVVD